jgi:hypothetical protein
MTELRIVRPSGFAVRVRVNDTSGGRRQVVAETVKVNKKTLWVRLPDGKIVKRRFTRDAG